MATLHRENVRRTDMFSKILSLPIAAKSPAVIRTARRWVFRTVAVYSDADRVAQHVIAADEARHIGGPRPVDSG